MSEIMFWLDSKLVMNTSWQSLKKLNGLPYLSVTQSVEYIQGKDFIYMKNEQEVRGFI